MQTAPFIHRVTSYSKLSKLFILAIALLTMIATMVTATAATPPLKANALLARMQVQGTNTYLNVNMSFRAQETGNAASLKTGSAASGTSGGFAQFNASFTKNWDGRITAPIPTGYTAVSDNCSQVDAYSPLGQGLMQNIPNGTYQTCTFIVKKNSPVPVDNATIAMTATPNSSLHGGDTVQIKFVVRNTGNTTLTSLRIWATPGVLPIAYVSIPNLAAGGSYTSINYAYKIADNQTSSLSLIGGLNGSGTNGTLPDIYSDLVLDVIGPKDVSKDSLSMTASLDRLPTYIGDVIHFSITIKNTGTSSLSNIKLSHLSNENATLATIAGLYAGWSQTVVLPYTWDGSNFLASTDKLVVTATPLNPDNTAKPRIRFVF